MMDGVPSKVNVLFVGNVQSWVSVLFMESVQSCVDFLIVLFMDCVQSWSRHQNLQEDWIGYTGYQHKFMSIKSMSSLKPGATRCHGTRICKRCPSTSLYEFRFV